MRPAGRPGVPDRAGGKGPADAVALLKDEHETVEKFFKKFEKAGDAACRANARA
ncbi:hypothetical protein [Streptomyces sp. NBC_01198]|uniref:hypothetical protein n=1 Tax=Streptomyces sp. NBC_01198 TaxID=2903769 RepID=UPI002E0D61DF|nr:hypothetical protein OG702_04075 [Streptomyces sp. NBC_01198]